MESRCHQFLLLPRSSARVTIEVQPPDGFVLNTFLVIAMIAFAIPDALGLADYDGASLRHSSSGALLCQSVGDDGITSGASDGDDSFTPTYTPQELTLYDDTQREKNSRSDTYGFEARYGLQAPVCALQATYEAALIRNLQVQMRDYLNSLPSGENLMCEAEYRIADNGQLTNIEIIQKSTDAEFDRQLESALGQVRLIVMTCDSECHGNRALNLERVISRECRHQMSEKYRTRFSSINLRFREEPQRPNPSTRIDWSKPVLRPDVL